MKFKKHCTLYVIPFLIGILFQSCGDSSEKETEKIIDINAADYWEYAELVWSDEFDGTQLSSYNWDFETGQHGWGNNEWQNYVANENVEVSNGTLKIIAKKVGDGQEVGDYTSTRLNSTKDFTFGKMEIRAKLPDHKGNGLWPALWMLGSSVSTKGWPACGEIDMMEYVSYDPNNVHFTIHSTANNHVDGTQASSGPVVLETAEEEFHTYGLLWSEEYLKFYIDSKDNVKFTFERPEGYTEQNWPFSKPFYFIMNIAVGGNWGGIEGVDDTIFPAIMEVDYVRVYQVKQ
ncbi:MAG: glycoside hydrolase family 16 protein [Maribacter sp.]|uniref:glycoside hydrolase family 16 protein n=1 Tax=Maribacter sp. TaxID=1897614 RepID=UPI003C72C5D2